MNPKAPGRYLLLCYEWVGLANAKPKEPKWYIRDWIEAKTIGGKLYPAHWERTNYQWDTGGYENFEAVRWQELPPVT